MTDLDTAPVRTQQPADIGAEMEVLGALIRTHGSMLDEIVEATGLTGRHFHTPRHQHIWDVIAGLADRDQPVSPAEIRAAFEREGALSDIQNGVYIQTLDANCTLTVNAAYYAKKIVARAKLRDLIASATQTIQRAAASTGEDVDDIIGTAQKALDELAEQGIQAADYEPLRDRWDDVIDEVQQAQDGKAQGILTGFRDVDALTGGLKDGQLVVLAAAPATGKTTFALDVGRNAAGEGTPIGVFVMEQGRKEIERKILSAMSGVSLSMLKGEVKMSGRHWDKVAAAHTRWETSPIYIDENPHVSLNVLRSRGRRMVKRDGVRLIIVDQLSLMAAESKGGQSREREVAGLVRGVKLIAKELGVPIILIHQFSRSPSTRTDKRPLLSDLKDSSEVEASADIVILMYRESLYDKECPTPNDTDLIFAKHRDGRTDTVTIDANLAYSKFQDPPR